MCPASVCQLRFDFCFLNLKILSGCLCENSFVSLLHEVGANSSVSGGDPTGVSRGCVGDGQAVI